MLPFTHRTVLEPRRFHGAALGSRWSPTVALLLIASSGLLAGCSPATEAPAEAGAGGNSTVGGGTGGTVIGDGDGDGDGDAPPPPGTVPGGINLNGSPEYHGYVRLTHLQWERSVRDLFELSDTVGLSSSLHPDPPAGRFSNNELGLYVGEELWLDYQRVAEEIAEMVATDAALVAQLGGLADRGAFITKIAHRAFRRVPTAEELIAYETLWDLGATYYGSGDAAVDGARVVLEALLQSPHFLYRSETAGVGSRLSGVELATKLSLLLKNTIPSDELLASAEAGQLDTDAGLNETAQAMLEEVDATEVLGSFHSELYGLDRYKNIEKSPQVFPSYSEQVNEALVDADRLFFERVYNLGGGIREILTTDVAFVNDQTAPYYGLTATGPQLSEVQLDATRPGFLTRVSFLAYNANLDQPDPIHRGVDINNRMLCVELSPPPGEIPPLPAPEAGQTNRERVVAHTGEGVCANCHLTIINPLGFAFENFDAMGQIRTEDNGNPIDTADTYEFADGLQSFSGSSELISLMANHAQVHGCYSARLAEFVLARDVAGTEQDLVTEMQTVSLDQDASIKSLILTMVQDPLFTTAQGGAQ